MCFFPVLLTGGRGGSRFPPSADIWRLSLKTGEIVVTNLVRLHVNSFNLFITGTFTSKVHSMSTIKKKIIYTKY